MGPRDVGARGTAAGTETSAGTMGEEVAETGGGGDPARTMGTGQTIGGKVVEEMLRSGPGLKRVDRSGLRRTEERKGAGEVRRWKQNGQRSEQRC